MQRNILEKYDRLVPRYTSYPTAPQFHDGIGSETYTDWLRNLDADIPLSLYVHIPFCDTMCWFCGCNTKVVNRYAPIEAYFDTLMDEIDLIAGILGPDRIANHIHWGGGTPTILNPEHLLKLANKLRENFTLSPNAEFAVEIDPRELEDSGVEALAEGGISRASIGVQDVNPIVQKAVNRVQPIEVTRHIVDTLRANGITSINLDLMYGLPYQTVKGVEHNVDVILEMAPDRIALFGYAHVPWMKTHMKLINEDVLPGRDERHDQMLAAAEKLMANGYSWIGLDHFAKDEDSMSVTQRAGKLNRNFQGYTVDPCDALIGLGASSIGAHPNGYIQNHTPVQDWRRAIEDGVTPTARGVEISDDDRLRRAIIERLMCDLHVDVNAVCETYGRDPGELLSSFDTLAPMQDDGLCSIEGWQITIPEEARILMRSVASAFDKYLTPDAKRHSRAV